MAERLRAATAADAPVLASIDAVCNPSPWSAASFAETLARARAVVAVDAADTVLGFVVVGIAADECEVLDLAVLPAARRRGTGRALLQCALAQAAAAGARRCHLEVRESNLAAQALYARCGFVLDGRRRDYYGDGAGGREDALLLGLELDGACA
jgi:ribosomal-protein-alanine N-acetyltransferase